MDISNLATLYLSSILLLLGTCIFWFYKKTFNYWKSQDLDYLQPTIPFGNALSLILRKVTLGELFAKQYLEIKEKGLKHAGTYFYWKPVYMPVDPDIIKRILISDFEYFPNHGFYISDGDPLTTHIFNMENAKWRNIRAKFPTAFTSAKMRKMFVIMENMTEQLLQNLEVYAKSDTPLNIKSEISKFTMDIISSCALGIKTNTMKNENEELLGFGRKFFDDQWNVYNNSIVITIPRWILHKLNFRVMTKRTEEYFFNLFQRVIRNYRKENQVRRGDLADIILGLTEKHENQRDFSGKQPMEPINLDEFTSQCLVFLAASFETSSSTQTFALFELAKNPECQEKLRKEIIEVLAKHDDKITYDAVMEMKYLEKVVDETLRLYPVFPILPRVCLKNYKIPGTDTTLEKDTFVMISNMGIHRDPEYYPDPEKFDPERFSHENKAKRPFVAHVPFGEGPRICLGKRFGLLQTKVGLIAMVRNYDISLGKKTLEGCKFVPNELILRKTGDVWIHLRSIKT